MSNKVKKTYKKPGKLRMNWKKGLTWDCGKLWEGGSLLKKEREKNKQQREGGKRYIGWLGLQILNRKKTLKIDYSSKRKGRTQRVGVVRL